MDIDIEKMERFSANLHRHEMPLRRAIRKGLTPVFLSPTRVHKDSTGRLVDREGRLVTVEEGRAVYLDGEVFLPDSENVVHVSLVDEERRGPGSVIVTPSNRAVGEFRPIVVRIPEKQSSFTGTRLYPIKEEKSGCLVGWIRYILGI